MKKPLQSPGVNEAVSFDRVRAIRRSLRCYHFALVSLVPVVGLPLAFLALNLHRQIIYETGECWCPFDKGYRWWAALAAYWLLAWSFALAYLALFGLSGLLFVLLLFGGMKTWLLIRHYRHTTFVHWNPARRYVYLGMGLACAGCMGSLVTLGMIIALVLDR